MTFKRRPYSPISGKETHLDKRCIIFYHLPFDVIFMGRVRGIEAPKMISFHQKNCLISEKGNFHVMHHFFNLCFLGLMRPFQAQNRRNSLFLCVSMMITQSLKMNSFYLDKCVKEPERKLFLMQLWNSQQMLEEGGPILWQSHKEGGERLRGTEL